MSHFVHLQLLWGLWAWRPGMWCWSSRMRGCVPGARTHKHSPGSPLANSHFILTVRPAILFTLSVATHPLLLKQQPGRQELACSSVVKASDLHMTLVLERLSSKASEVLHKLWERQTDRQTEWGETDDGREKEWLQAGSHPSVFPRVSNKRT